MFPFIPAILLLALTLSLAGRVLAAPVISSQPGDRQVERTCTGVAGLIFFGST
jgi:hypothetical protein